MIASLKPRPQIKRVSFVEEIPDTDGTRTDVELGLDTARGDGLNDLEGVGVGGGEHTNNN